LSGAGTSVNFTGISIGHGFDQTANPLTDLQFKYTRQGDAGTTAGNVVLTPEPATAALIGIAAISLRNRKRRQV
jgi:hypothetical protein